MIPGRIISGGQTGVDRAALDFAIERGIPWGGWAPKGWRSEDGGIPEWYREHMREHDAADYRTRTRANVEDSDATLIITEATARNHHGDLTGGTRYTADCCMGWKSYLVADHDAARRATEIDRIRGWVDRLMRVGPIVLNIAGPRESKAPGIHAATLALLREVWP